MKKIVIILSLATLISIFSLIEVSGKPALNGKPVEWRLFVAYLFLIP